MVSIRSTLGKAARLFAVGCFLGSTTITTALGAEAELDVVEISNRFAAQMAAHTFWQAEMKQLLELPDMQPIVSEARLVYAKPDKLKIQIEKPLPQWLILYETVGWYQRGRSPRQSAELPAKSGPLALYQFLPKLLNGSLDELRSGYQLSGESIRPDLYQITLTASSSDVNPESILCQLDPNNLQLRSLRLQFRERQAAITMIFKQVQINVVLPDDTFKMEANKPRIGTKGR